MNNTTLTFGAALLIIFSLIAYIIFNKPVKQIEVFDEAPYRKEIRLKDSIADHWEQEAKAWSYIARIAEDKVDSLEQLKPQIYENHDDQINFNTTANDQQLDSVIRSNW
jgi:hypothetical protein